MAITIPATFTSNSKKTSRRNLLGASDGDTPRVNWNTAAHILSATIMGDNLKDSAVNRWGRTYDVSNLWVVGSSVFTTSATANPTLTIAALTLRTTAAIHRHLQGGN